MEKEILRQTVLEYLALRPSAAFPVATIARMLRVTGMVEKPVPETDVLDALTFLEGKGLVTSAFGGFGATKVHQATSDGVLAYERGV